MHVKVQCQAPGLKMHPRLVRLSCFGWALQAISTSEMVQHIIEVL